MLITREVDYALRILRATSDGKHVTVGDICKRETLPQQFVYKILKKIEQAGLVKITRGTCGGCDLMGDLKKTSLFDLLNVLSVESYIGSCTKPEYECEWRKQNGVPCTVHSQLQRIQDSLDEELRSCSLHKVIFGDD